MGRSTRVVLLGTIGVTLATAIAIACGDGDGDAPPPPLGAGDDGASSGDGSSSGDDASIEGSTLTPSFCQGLMLYASFDVGLKADLGGGEPMSLGSVAIAANGKFGAAASFTSDAAVSDGGGAMYFVRVDGGAPVYPDDEGSVAMWVRAPLLDGVIGAPGAQPVLARAVASLPPEPLVPSGLTLVSLPPQFGLAYTPVSNVTSYLHTFAPEVVRPFLRSSDFNHFVSAWRKTDGSLPSAYLTINGGLGQRFDDASAPDPYRDADVDDAGALRVPYRGYTRTPWEFPDASTRAFRIGAPTFQNVILGEVDDVGVWSRVLSFDEIAELYRSGVSLKEACQL